MWGHHAFFFFPFGILIFIFIIGGIVFRFRMARYGGCRRDWRDRYDRDREYFDDAEVIVRRRFANGEITEEEYLKLREALKM